MCMYVTVSIGVYAVCVEGMLHDINITCEWQCIPVRTVRMLIYINATHLGAHANSYNAEVQYLCMQAFNIYECMCK